MSEQQLYILSEILTATGLVEIIDKWTTPVRDGVRLCTLGRLRKEAKEADWVHRIVRPVRELGWRYPNWKIYTAKVYLDKDEKDGTRRVAYAFRLDIETPDPVLAIEMLNTVLKSGQVKPEQVRQSALRFLDELPDAVIERPLVWAEGLTDRNRVVPKPSKYFHITGQQTKPSAGVEYIADE